MGDFVIPEYPELKLNFPPILDILDFIEREEITRIHVSTPGTVGLLGLLIARLTDIPLAGTYHTDIPQYVRDLTDDEFLEQVAWSYMIWFYNQMEEVMAQSSGLPVIVSDAGGPRELMADGETGLVFKAGKRDDFVHAVGKLAGSRQLLAAMGRSARDFILDKAPDAAENYSTILRTGSARG